MSNKSPPGKDDSTDAVVTNVSRDPDRTIQLNMILDVLGDSRRRYVLYLLDEADGSVLPFEAVVEGVRKYEVPNGEKAELPPRQSVRTDLIHVHIPKLESVDLLEYMPRAGEIQFHGHPLLEEWAERTSRFELK